MNFVDTDSRRPSTGGRRWPIVGMLLAMLLLSLAAPATGQSGEDGAMDMDMDGAPMMMDVLGETDWQGMTVSLAGSAPVSHSLFQGDKVTMITPSPEDSLHIMAVLADTETGERIPYSSVWLTVTDESGGVVFDERMWPMLSQSMGTHYGINVPLPEAGQYTLALQVGPPQAARHPEYMERWLEAFAFETTLDWAG